LPLFYGEFASVAPSRSSDPLTTGALLDEGTARLAGPSANPLPQCHLDAEVLLAHVLGTSRTRLKSHPEELCTSDERQVYLALITRRAAGEPAAHLTGAKEFWSLRFTVGPDVLVPRPETELLVERALALRREAEGNVADLGTGSGAIAIALACERPAWRIVATDSCSAALGIARRNAASVGVGNVEFVEGSWFAPLEGHRFHLIASNPPYVAADDPLLAAAPLTFEPRGALASGADGLAALREIIRASPAHLERGGWLLLEHGATQAAQVARELVVRGFTHVRSHRDLAGHERVTEASWASRG
jgi:release factor glutamine methyltransferase